VIESIRWDDPTKTYLMCVEDPERKFKQYAQGTTIEEARHMMLRTLVLMICVMRGDHP
jgi:predicted RNase H-like HicB family nuclease